MLELSLKLRHLRKTSKPGLSSAQSGIWLYLDSLHQIDKQELLLAILTVKNPYLPQSTSILLPSTIPKEHHTQTSTNHPLAVSPPAPNLFTALKLINKSPDCHQPSSLLSWVPWVRCAMSMKLTGTDRQTHRQTDTSTY